MVVFEWIIGWIRFYLNRIVVVPKPAYVVEYYAIFGVESDIYSLIKATKHEQHVVDCLDGSVSDAMGGIWHHAEDQRTNALVLIVEFGSQVFHHLNDNAFI